MGRVPSARRHISAASRRNLASSLPAVSSPLKARSSACWASKGGDMRRGGASLSENMMKASRWPSASVSQKIVAWRISSVPGSLSGR